MQVKPSNVVHSSFYDLRMANINMSTQSAPQQNQNIHDGSVAIFWDMETCPVLRNIGFLCVSWRDVTCIGVPKGRSVFGAILVDVFLFALDRRPPAYIMLISGDRNFSHALHRLGDYRYTVILAIPSRVGVSEPFRNAGSFVWDWPSLPKTSRTYSYPNSLKCRYVRHVSSNEYNDSMRVQPGHVNGLKRELVPPLESSGGQLPLDEIELEGRNKKVHIKKCLPRLANPSGEKMSDVRVLVEEPESKLKYVRAADLFGNRRELLKFDLKKLLTSYARGILLDCFEYIIYTSYGLKEHCTMQNPHLLFFYSFDSMASGSSNVMARHAIDEISECCGVTETPKYMNFFIFQEISECKRLIRVLRDEVDVAKSALGQVNAMIAEMEAMDDPFEYADSLGCLKDSKRILG
ncbi:endonuclease [Tanacetum coccineum]